MCSVELVGSHYLITELWYLEPGVEPQSWEGCGGIYRVGLSSHVFPSSLAPALLTLTRPTTFTEHLSKNITLIYAITA